MARRAIIKTWWVALPNLEAFIHAIFDFDAKKVFVGPLALATMAKASLEAGIASDEDAIGFAVAILGAPRIGGLFDVTEVGGGWREWVENYIDHDSLQEPALTYAVEAHAALQDDGVPMATWA